MYSYRIEQAIRAAAVLHRTQVRKGEMPYPYITHVVAVAFLLFDYTTDEDVIIAALLHDTIEDTDYTVDELEEDFGANVRNLVETVTEPTTDKETALQWAARKKQYISQLEKGPTEALLIAAADKIHNMRSVVETYYEEPSQFLKDFGGTCGQRLEMYQVLANLFNRRLKNDIIHEFNHVFAEYKEFVYRVQTNENIS